MTELIRVENLSKIYGKGETQTVALNNVSFTINKGEFVAIVGPSGSGKSTLMHILGGVDKPTTGKVIVDGVNICDISEKQLAIFRRRQVGLVYQFYNLIPVLNVKGNITLPLMLDSREINKEYLQELTQTLGINEKLRAMPNELSGGQQQRVSIARALITSPSVLLADEPTGNLDSKNSSEIVSLLKDFNKKHGQTIIVITHDKSIALGADRVLSVVDGQLTESAVSE